MSVHTPGPWVADGPYIVQSDTHISVPGMVVVAKSLEEAPVIANVFGPYGEECSPETQRNARLMAAAPDLFNALQDVDDSLSTLYEQHPQLAGQFFGAALKQRMESAIGEAKSC